MAKKSFIEYIEEPGTDAVPLAEGIKALIGIADFDEKVQFVSDTAEQFGDVAGAVAATEALRDQTAVIAGQADASADASAASAVLAGQEKDAAEGFADDAAADAAAIAAAIGLIGEALVETQAAAEAMAIDPTKDALRTSGFRSIGDLGAASFARGFAPAVLHFQDTNAAYWNLTDDEILPEMAGAYGNNFNDDQPFFQKAADSGKTIIGANDTRYLLSSAVQFENGGFRGAGKARTFVATTDLVNDVFIGRNTEPFDFSNFRLEGSPSKTTGAGIRIAPTAGTNSRSRFMGIEFSSLPIGLQTTDAVNFGVLDCYFANYITAGFWNESDRLPDGGDSYLLGNTFVSTIYSGLGAAMVQKNGGGLKVGFNKVLQGNYGFLMGLIGGSLAPTQSTSILLFGFNSIEHCRIAAMYLGRDPLADPSIGFSQAIVVGNQINCQPSPAAVVTPYGIFADGSLPLGMVVLAQNTIFLASTGGDAINLTNVDDAIIGGNVIIGGGGTSRGVVTAADTVPTMLPNLYRNLTTPQTFGGSVIHFDRATLRGTGVQTPTTAYGTSLFISAPQAVVFSRTFAETPFVAASIIDGGSGGVSVLINSVTPTGFSYVVVAVNNVSNVDIQWEATGVL